VDGIDIGRFKSSGIIVSTGTGSSGWLYGAKRVTAQNVNLISKEILDQEDASVARDELDAWDGLASHVDDHYYLEELATQMSK